MNGGRKTLVGIFGAPALILLLSVAGLIAALAYEGPADLIACLAVATPAGAVVYAFIRSRQRPAQTTRS